MNHVSLYFFLFGGFLVSVAWSFVLEHVCASA